MSRYSQQAAAIEWAIAQLNELSMLAPSVADKREADNLRRLREAKRTIRGLAMSAHEVEP